MVFLKSKFVNTRFHNPKKGQTILELIFVISIVSSSMVMFASLLDNAIRMDSYNKEKSKARTLSMEGLEFVRTRYIFSPSDLSSVCPATCYLDAGLVFKTDEPTSKIADNFLKKDYTRKINFSIPPTSTMGQVGVPEVIIEVSWISSFTGRPSSVAHKVQL